MEKDEIAKAYINNKMAGQNGIEHGEEVSIQSEESSIKVQIQLDDSISDNIIMMYVGWWKKHGNPNWILKSGISDMGGQVTYNDNWVTINKL